jgi:esterase/lipase
MDFKTFLKELHTLQDRLVNMPESEALSDTFAQEQEKLSKLLDNLSKFSKADQDNAREEMQLFAERLSDKLQKLKQKMRDLSQDISMVENRTRGMKAYNQERFFK